MEDYDRIRLAYPSTDDMLAAMAVALARYLQPADPLAPKYNIEFISDIIKEASEISSNTLTIGGYLVNIESLGQVKALHESLRGKLYRALVEAHLRKTSIDQKQKAIEYEVSMLPTPLREHASEFLDFWISLYKNPDVLGTDASQVLTAVCDHSAKFAAKYGAQVTDAIVFGLFQIVTVNAALNAERDMSFRKFVGIKKWLFS